MFLGFDSGRGVSPFVLEEECTPGFWGLCQDAFLAATADLALRQPSADDQSEECQKRNLLLKTTFCLIHLSVCSQNYSSITIYSSK